MDAVVDIYRLLSVVCNLPVSHAEEAGTGYELDI